VLFTRTDHSVGIFQGKSETGEKESAEIGGHRRHLTLGAEVEERDRRGLEKRVERNKQRIRVRADGLVPNNEVEKRSSTLLTRGRSGVPAGVLFQMVSTKRQENRPRDAS